MPDNATSDPTQESCLICSLENADERTRVFADDLWAAESVPGYDAPGWFFLRNRRHAELLTGLDADEIAAFGPRAQDLVAAVKEVTGAPAVYLMTFGENYRHFHALVAARFEDTPKEFRGGSIVRKLAEMRDTEASLALVPAVREAYQRLAAARGELTPA